MAPANNSTCPPCYRQFTTRDPESASQRVGELFANPARVLSSGGRFFMRLQAATLGAVTLASIDVAHCEIRREAGGAVVVVLPQSGRLTMGDGPRRRDCEPNGTLGVGRVGEDLRFALESGAALSITTTPAALCNRAERLGGRAPNAAAIADRIDSRAPAAAALNRAARSAIAELATLHSQGLAALAAGAYEDLLLSLTAAALFPELAPAEAQARDAGPAAVRRARDYIREHAASPVDLTRLAADLGVSMRALQQNFQRSFGLSPRDFVLDCRLERARRALTAPRAPSVTDVALESGFSDLSHFSARYRAKYGELPSQTLRAAQTV